MTHEQNETSDTSVMAKVEDFEHALAADETDVHHGEIRSGSGRHQQSPSSDHLSTSTLSADAVGIRQNDTCKPNGGRLDPKVSARFSDFRYGDERHSPPEFVNDRSKADEITDAHGEGTAEFASLPSDRRLRERFENSDPPESTQKAQCHTERGGCSSRFDLLQHDEESRHSETDLLEVGNDEESRHQETMTCSPTDAAVSSNQLSPGNCSDERQDPDADENGLFSSPSSNQFQTYLGTTSAAASSKPLKCPRCNWHYKYVETLEIHFREKHIGTELVEPDAGEPTAGDKSTPTDDHSMMTSILPAAARCPYCAGGAGPHPRLARGETHPCGYKPYRCDVCSYSTTTKGNLSIHMQSDRHLNNIQELASRAAIPLTSSFLSQPSFVQPVSMAPGSALAELRDAQLPNHQPQRHSHIHHQQQLRHQAALEQQQMTSASSLLFTSPACHQTNRTSASTRSLTPVTAAASMSSGTPSTPTSRQDGSPAWRCDICGYATAVARNLRIHMTSEKHAHNLAVFQQQQQQKQLHQIQRLQLESIFPPNSPLMLSLSAGSGLSLPVPPGYSTGIIDRNYSAPSDSVLSAFSSTGGGVYQSLGMPHRNRQHQQDMTSSDNSSSSPKSDGGHQRVERDEVTRSSGGDVSDQVNTSERYECNLCQYGTSARANFIQHCQTDKHNQRLVSQKAHDQCNMQTGRTEQPVQTLKASDYHNLEGGDIVDLSFVQGRRHSLPEAVTGPSRDRAALMTSHTSSRCRLCQMECCDPVALKHHLLQEHMVKPEILQILIDAETGDSDEMLPNTAVSLTSSSMSSASDEDCEQKPRISAAFEPALNTNNNKTENDYANVISCGESTNEQTNYGNRSLNLSSRISRFMSSQYPAVHGRNSTNSAKAEDSSGGSFEQSAELKTESPSDRIPYDKTNKRKSVETVEESLRAEMQPEIKRILLDSCQSERERGCRSCPEQRQTQDNKSDAVFTSLSDRSRSRKPLPSYNPSNLDQFESFDDMAAIDSVGTRNLTSSSSTLKSRSQSLPDCSQINDGDNKPETSRAVSVRRRDDDVFESRGKINRRNSGSSLSSANFSSDDEGSNDDDKDERARQSDDGSGIEKGAAPRQRQVRGLPGPMCDLLQTVGLECIVRFIERHHDAAELPDYIRKWLADLTASLQLLQAAQRRGPPAESSSDRGSHRLDIAAEVNKTDGCETDRSDRRHAELLGTKNEAPRSQAVVKQPGESNAKNPMDDMLARFAEQLRKDPDSAYAAGLPGISPAFDFQRLAGLQLPPSAMLGSSTSGLAPPYNLIPPQILMALIMMANSGSAPGMLSAGFPGSLPHFAAGQQQTADLNSNALRQQISLATSICNSSSSDAARGTATGSGSLKRMRTRIGADQLAILRARFDMSAGQPADEELATLAGATGLPVKVVKHWFRNTLFKQRQRSKDSTGNLTSSASVTHLASTNHNDEKYEGETETEPPSSSYRFPSFRLKGALDDDRRSLSDFKSLTPTVADSIRHFGHGRDDGVGVSMSSSNGSAIGSDSRHGSVARSSKFVDPQFESRLSNSVVSTLMTPSAAGGASVLSDMLRNELVPFRTFPGVPIIGGNGTLPEPLLAQAASAGLLIHPGSTQLPPPTLSAPNALGHHHSNSRPTQPQQQQQQQQQQQNQQHHQPHHGKRASRTHFSDDQVRILQDHFERNAYPRDDELESLSRRLGLSARVIVVWFQNARQKARRSYENQAQQTNHHRQHHSTANDSSAAIVSPKSGTTSTTTDSLSPGDGKPTAAGASLRYECRLCPAVFQRYYELIKHQRSHQQQPQTTPEAGISDKQAAPANPGCSELMTEQRRGGNIPSTSVKSKPIGSGTTTNKAGSSSGETSVQPYSELPANLPAAVRHPAASWPPVAGVPAAAAVTGPHVADFGLLASLLSPAAALFTGSVRAASSSMTIPAAFSDSIGHGLGIENILQMQSAALNLTTTMRPQRKSTEAAVERSEPEDDDFSSGGDGYRRTSVMDQCSGIKSEGSSMSATDRDDIYERLQTNVTDERHSRFDEKTTYQLAIGLDDDSRCSRLDRHHRETPLLMDDAVDPVEDHSNHFRLSERQSMGSRSDVDENSDGESKTDLKPHDDWLMAKDTSLIDADKCSVTRCDPGEGAAGRNALFAVSGDLRQQMEDFKSSSLLKGHISQFLPLNEPPSDRPPFIKSEEFVKFDAELPLDLSKSVEKNASDQKIPMAAADLRNIHSSSGAVASSAVSTSTKSSSSSTTPSSRRHRTHMTDHQVRVMRAIYVEHRTPSIGECSTLGARIGLARRVVQVWFQNARAKDKKLAAAAAASIATNDVTQHHQHHTSSDSRPFQQVADSEAEDAPTGGSGSGDQTVYPTVQCKWCGTSYSSSRSATREHVFTAEHVSAVDRIIRSSDGGPDSLSADGRRTAGGKLGRAAKRERRRLMQQQQQQQQQAMAAVAAAAAARRIMASSESIAQLPVRQMTSSSLSGNCDGLFIPADSSAERVPYVIDRLSTRYNGFQPSYVTPADLSTKPDKFPPPPPLAASISSSPHQTGINSKYQQPVSNIGHTGTSASTTAAAVANASDVITSPDAVRPIFYPGGSVASSAAPVARVSETGRIYDRQHQSMWSSSSSSSPYDKERQPLSISSYSPPLPSLTPSIVVHRRAAGLLSSGRLANNDLSGHV